MKPKAHTLEPMTRSTWVLLAVILLASAALRLYRLADRSIWFDEGATVYAAQVIRQPLAFFSPMVMGESSGLPAFVLLWQWITDTLFGFPLASYGRDFMIRLVPWLFSVGTLGVVFALARRLTGKNNIALWATFLTGVSPLQVYYAQEVRPYSSMTFVLCFVYIFAARALREDQRRAWLWLLVTSVASMYTHLVSVWYLLTLNLFAAIVLLFPAGRVGSFDPALHTDGKWRITRLAKWAATQVALLVLIIPALAKGFIVEAAVRDKPQSWYPPLRWRDGLITVKSFFAGYSPDPAIYWTLFAMGLVAMAAGLYALRRQRGTVLLLLLCIVVPILANLLQWKWRNFSFYEHRLFIFSACAAFVLAGAGLTLVKRRWGMAVIAVVWTALSFHCVEAQHAQRFPSQSHLLGVRYTIDARAVSQEILSRRQAGDAIIHNVHMTFFPLRYHYLPDMPQYDVGFTEGDISAVVDSAFRREVWENAGAAPVRIEEIAAKHKRLWFVVSWWDPFNVPKSAQTYLEWLDHHALRLEQFAFPGASLYLYDLEAMRTKPKQTVRAADAAPSPQRHPSQPNTGLHEVYIPFYSPDGGRDELVDKANRLAQENGKYSTRASWGMTFISPDITDPSRYRESGIVFSVLNDGQAGRPIPPARQTLYAAARVIEPMDFTRETPRTDSWFPSLRLDPPVANPLETIVMTAQTRAEGPEGDRLYAPLQLDPGIYTVFAHVWNVNGPERKERAVLDFTVARGDTPEATPLAPLSQSVAASAQRAPDGWGWQAMGLVHSDGAPMRLYVRARNVWRAPTAYADLGRVVFVPGEKSTYTPLYSTPQELNADSIALKDLPDPYPDLSQTRYDFFLNAPDGTQTRRVSVVCPRATTTP